jgi:ABC-type Fe3+ transport system substrate-binding protein
VPAYNFVVSTCKAGAVGVKSIGVKPTLYGLLATGALCLSLAGCGGGNDAGTQAASTQTITIVSPHGREIQGEFERAFKSKNPDAVIKWQDQGASSDALRFILAQFKTKENKDDGIGADLFFGGGLESHMELEEEKLLDELPSDYDVPATLNGVPLRGKNNEWVGAALSGFGILYNKTIATRDGLPVPKVWADLGKKELFGRVELADPRRSGSAHVAYEIILQTSGWEQGWKTLAAMSGNARAYIDSSSTLVNDVSSGEAVFVPAIDFYGRAKIDQAGAEKLGYVAPQGQSVVTPDPIAILKGAPNKELAQKFVAFVMSPEGQKLWMLKKGAQGGPVQETLFRQASLPTAYEPMPKDSVIESSPFKVKNERPYEAEKAAVRRVVIDDLIGAVLIDNHNLIKARQQKSCDAGILMLAPTEADVMAATKIWDDPVQRQKKLGEWRAAAQKQLQ